MMNKFGPPINRSMRELDRSFFQKDVKLLVACFSDPKYIGSFVKECKNYILFLPSVKHIVQLDKTTKGVLLRDDIDNLDNYQLKLDSMTLSKIQDYNIAIQEYTMRLDYNFWKADDILRAVLPEDLIDDVPSGFAQAGHVAHLNLRDDFKPYGKLIGQVILDKNSKVETVVDKVDSIATKFRTFKMNVLAGKNDLLVEQSESGCRFRFDFSTVYWNSRLSTEHERLIRQFKEQEAVCDVFAGVGPFAVPAGKLNVLVLANDLNPESFKYLKENIALNHVDNFVKPFNLDGRDFIKKSPKLLLDWAENEKFVERKRLVKRRKLDESGKGISTDRNYEIMRIDIPSYFGQYVMNLPDSALTFLDSFIGLYSDPLVKSLILKDPTFKLPIINVHCFEKYSPQERPEPLLDELHRRIHKKIVKTLEYDLPIEDMDFHLVRRVAPTKPMFCVRFLLPEVVAFRR